MTKYSCRVCNETKDESYFSKDKRRSHQPRQGIDTQCKKCKSSKNAAYNHGISLEEYKRGMATSNCCQLCSSKHKLAFDQDHITKKFRGVLCMQCNASLGKFGDSIEGLERVVQYLKGEI